MRYYSTRNPKKFYTFTEAVKLGLAPDGGLFLPERIPSILQKPEELKEKSLPELAHYFLEPFVSEIEKEVFATGIEKETFASEIEKEPSAPEIEKKLFSSGIKKEVFAEIIEKTFNFPVEVTTLSDNLSVAELYHGRTLAFKDFGARFLANTMEHLLRQEGKKCKILVATSGDTGSAVANGFLGMENVEVVLLYPSGMVSKIQEQQLTTMGENITALEVKGNFDDCQRLVKQAFEDSELRKKVYLSSANSISIARLLPQTVYYIYAFLQLFEKYERINFVVPSGNLGNITAGLLTKLAGLPVGRFFAALNSNKALADYLHSGVFEARATIPTISNAMDVGNPSNIERIVALFNGDIERIRTEVIAKSYGDPETLAKIGDIYNRYGYLIDPHTAVGVLFAEELTGGTANFGSVAVGSKGSFSVGSKEGAHYIVISTAHPAKFYEDVKKAIGAEFQIPPRLAECLDKQKQSQLVDPDYAVFREIIAKSV
ncbi:MAG: threonine synthase [Ignavibacteriaceae bacterium]|nr:threonine synthase [Ignavibacteriaceae bacterium]